MEQQSAFGTNLDGGGEGIGKEEKDKYAIIPATVKSTMRSWTSYKVLPDFLQTTTVFMEFRGLLPVEETKTIVTTYKKVKKTKKRRNKDFDFDSTEENYFNLDDDIDPSEFGYFKPAKIYSIPKTVDNIIIQTRQILQKFRLQQNLDLEQLATEIIVDIDRELFDMGKLPVSHTKEEDVVDRFNVKFAHRLQDKIVTKQNKMKKLKMLNEILQEVLGEEYMVPIKETKPKKSILHRLRRFFGGCFLNCRRQQNCD